MHWVLCFGYVAIVFICLILITSLKAGASEPEREQAVVPCTQPTYVGAQPPV